MSIEIRRAYEDPGKRDGFRVLVDRIWPRGVSKDSLKIDWWPKDIAPSTELRKWFGHDPEKWVEFKRRYFHELASAPEGLEELLRRAKRQRVTLVFAARDCAHNNAVALKAYLERRIRRARDCAGPDGS